jgi:putative GTP pyrophosphokinase
MESNVLLEKYDSDIELYKNLAQSMNTLVNSFLSSSEISPHSVSSRVKERSSLSRKIDTKSKYNSIEQVTDITGIRIITHYSDEVDKIAEIIEKEFLVDTENSIDKRSSLDPDRFGYLSVHYVVSLRPDRCALLEYKRFDNLKFEIQIRSILQHTWAEIEHDIGYKAKVEVPKPIRRKFSRLAGLLELADSEFVGIRNDLESYEKTIQEKLPTEPENIDIDVITIQEYIKSSKTVKDLEEKVVKLANLVLEPLGKDSALRLVTGLQYFGLNSISELETELLENEVLILKRARDVGNSGEERRGEGNPSKPLIVKKGITIYYLNQVLASKFIDEGEILKYLDNLAIGFEDDRVKFANYLSNLTDGSGT